MRRTIRLLLLPVGLFLCAAPAHAAPPAQAQQNKSGVRSPVQRLNALRALTLTKQQKSGASIATPKRVASTYYKAGNFSGITLKAGVPKPTIDDVTITAGVDGNSTSVALATVRSKMTTKLAAQNSAFVDKTILDTHKAFTIAVSNVYVAGSPPNKLISPGGDLAGAEISVLGVMSAVHPTVIMAKKPGERVSRFFVPAGGGAYEELKSMPYAVIMKARLQNGAQGGIRVSYQRWGNQSLGEQLTTITELGSGGAP